MLKGLEVLDRIVRLLLVRMLANVVFHVLHPANLGWGGDQWSFKVPARQLFVSAAPVVGGGGAAAMAALANNIRYSRFCGKSAEDLDAHV